MSDLAALTRSRGFRSDARFGTTLPAIPPEAEDPLSQAYARGFEAGWAEAEAKATALAEAEAQARAQLSLAFVRLDQSLAEEMRQRLHDTVAALCEAALAPLALDADALMRRIEAALALFARADDEKVLRLHPDDMALISARIATDWQVLPDPALARGALRVEAQTGGVEDGPAQWRLAIAEALRQC